MSFFDDGSLGQGRFNFSLEPLLGIHAFIVEQAAATSSLTLTGSDQDVPGATITLNTPGVYVVMGVFDFDGAAGDGIGVGSLKVDTVTRGTQALADLSATNRITAPQTWIVVKTTLGPTVLKLLGRIAGATGGGSTISAGHTTIVAFTVPGSQDLSLLT